MKQGINFTKQARSKIDLYKNSEYQSTISNLAQKSLIVFYNKLSGYFLKRAELETEANRDRLLMEANQYINKATDISYQEASTSVNRGYSSIISGQFAQAEREFDHVLHVNNKDVLSLLGKAQIKFNIENYEEALDFFKKAININPLLPLSVYNA